MHAVVRTYAGPNAAQFIDEMERNKDEIERLITAIDGLVSYTLVRTDEGGASVSVYQTKDGGDASSRAVERLVETALSADDRVTPTVSDGVVVVHLDAPVDYGWRGRERDG
jgi:photosystem II stability/assembly factor-like uncharacterized protein